MEYRKPAINVFDWEPYKYNFLTYIICFIFIIRGPLAVLRLVGGGGLRGDAHRTGLTPDVLVSQYLSVNQVDRAVNILLSLNWDAYGFICLACLQRIVNHLFRQPLTPEREG